MVRKLAQVRCEITQSMIKDEPSKPAMPSELGAIQEENRLEEEESELGDHCNRALLGEDVISENLVSNLIENVKLDANLNEDKAIIVANSVIKTLSENIHVWSMDCKKILGMRL